MSLNQFITDMLNIKSEDLESVQHVKQSDDTLLIKVKLKKKPVVCPYCKGPVKIHSYYPRKLTHSTLVGRKCFIVYLQRRYYCASCDVTFQEHNPFINSSEGLTYETKINVLKELKHPYNTYTATAKRFNISKTKVFNIFDKHVNIPRKPLPMVLSMDEHYFPESSYSSLYCCLLMDFLTGVLIDVLPDRKKDYIIHYLSLIKKDTFNWNTKKSELDNVKYLSIDLYDNYKSIALAYFPQAIICADSFHVLTHLTDAFHKIVLRCRRNTEDEDAAYLLMKFRFVFDHNTTLDNEPRYNKTLGRYVNYRDIRDILFNHFPVIKQAYELKEYYINFNRTCIYDNASAYLEETIARFADSNIREYDEFYILLRNWESEIANSFILVNKKRINNSYIESKNRQLERLIYNANGFTNFNRTRNRILYCLNKDDTYTI